MRDEAAYLGKHSGSIRGREEEGGGGEDLGGERLKQAEGLEGVCDAVTPGRRMRRRRRRRRRRGISF